MSTSINFQSKFKLISEYWSPKVIAEMNDYQFKLVKVKGNFVWLNHENTDEVFIVIEGSMVIKFKDREVEINQGEMFVVPKNKQHKPFAINECKILIIEPKGVINTGNSNSDLTAPNDIWI